MKPYLLLMALALFLGACPCHTSESTCASWHDDMPDGAAGIRAYQAHCMEPYEER